MTSSVLPNRVSAVFRRALPAVLVLILSLMGAVRVPLPGASNLFGSLTLLGIYYWVVHRPASIPVVLAFALGLLSDILGETRSGTGPLLLLALYGATLWGRSYLVNRPFIVVWLGASVAVGVIMMLESIVLWVREDLWVGWRSISIGWLMATALYPGVAALLNRVQRRFVQDH